MDGHQLPRRDNRYVDYGCFDEGAVSCIQFDFTQYLCVVVSETSDVLNELKPFNLERCVNALKALPKLPKT